MFNWYIESAICLVVFLIQGYFFMPKDEDVTIGLILFWICLAITPFLNIILSVWLIFGWVQVWFEAGVDALSRSVRFGTFLNKVYDILSTTVIKRRD